MRALRRLFLISTLLFISTVAYAQRTVTLYGIIDQDEHLITDTGQTYEFIPGPKIDEILLFKGKRLEVKGKIQDLDGEKALMLFEFSPIKKKSQPIPEKGSNYSAED